MKEKYTDGRIKSVNKGKSLWPEPRRKTAETADEATKTKVNLKKTRQIGGRVDNEKLNESSKTKEIQLKRLQDKQSRKLAGKFPCRVYGQRKEGRGKVCNHVEWLWWWWGKGVEEEKNVPGYWWNKEPIELGGWGLVVGIDTFGLKATPKDEKWERNLEDEMIFWTERTFSGGKNMRTEFSFRSWKESFPSVCGQVK